MEEETLQSVQRHYHGKLSSYLLGFFLCATLTIIAFGLVMAGWPSVSIIIYSIAMLALIQAAIQLKFFLKLGHEGKPHWQTIIFSFLLLVLLVIVIGSLWIMFDLNARMMNM